MRPIFGAEDVNPTGLFPLAPYAWPKLTEQPLHLLERWVAVEAELAGNCPVRLRACHAWSRAGEVTAGRLVFREHHYDLLPP